MIDLPLTQLATEVLTIYDATWQLNKNGSPRQTDLLIMQYNDLLIMQRFNNLSPQRSSEKPKTAPRRSQDGPGVSKGVDFSIFVDLVFGSKFSSAAHSVNLKHFAKFSWESLVTPWITNAAVREENSPAVLHSLLRKREKKAVLNSLLVFQSLCQMQSAF